MSVRKMLEENAKLRARISALEAQVAQLEETMTTIAEFSERWMDSDRATVLVLSETASLARAALDGRVTEKGKGV